MKHIALFFLIPFFGFAQLPEGFVYVNDVIPSLKVELRYHGTNNFMGKPVNGYKDNVLILSKEAAFALKEVHAELIVKNLGLKVFDGYRPQKAVNNFIFWAKQLEDTVAKSEFYPDVKKQNLFKAGYIASRSGHSRGSTVDLTLIDLETGQELDMGSPYDFFGKQSWVKHSDLTAKQKQNRQLLQRVMRKHGFRGYSKEWWHFTLNNEPYKNTYFNFDIKYPKKR